MLRIYLPVEMLYPYYNSIPEGPNRLINLNKKVEVKFATKGRKNNHSKSKYLNLNHLMIVIKYF